MTDFMLYLARTDPKCRYSAREAQAVSRFIEKYSYFAHNHETVGAYESIGGEYAN